MTAPAGQPEPPDPLDQPPDGTDPSDPPTDFDDEPDPPARSIQDVGSEVLANAARARRSAEINEGLRTARAVFTHGGTSFGAEATVHGDAVSGDKTVVINQYLSLFDRRRRLESGFLCGSGVSWRRGAATVG